MSLKTKKIKVGITGLNGFIGWHLKQRLLYISKRYEIIHFQRDFFNSEKKISNFLKKCDVLVHLAAVNRHEKINYIYEENIRISQILINSLIKIKPKPKIILASSVQEKLDNEFGKSKRKVRSLFEEFGLKYKTSISSLIIPNIFGPFCKPNYNSFVSTFCHGVLHKKQIKIENNRGIDLLYIDQLIEVFTKCIDEIYNKTTFSIETIHQFNTSNIDIKEVYKKIVIFKKEYFDNGIIPDLNKKIDLDLFNTFRSFINLNHFPKKLKKHKDHRGFFSELIKTKSEGQTSVSLSFKNIERGNHFHTRKIERFYIFKGEALVQLRKVDTNEIFNIKLSSDENNYLDIPIWYTHNLVNTGNDELYSVFWISEHFDEDDPDTYYLNVNQEL